ncbi:hypothetical protein FUT69_10410 [Xylella taiwanensis]|nr:hypothetical protein [Xylella taiwanensis]AXI82818.1 hypothetical protein AB672_02025 [Xylella taiwanensis]MCD8455830.1 hypothetical protein [Xylella taiwanensis]MCD8458235.1 hypothetical protein [Xylella taiwanensis]MCD8460373.1 hypothetical protein [Xylella taiwanensis]MCD8463569.1 hypothetical protein [Xylella taiwanensis]
MLPGCGGVPGVLKKYCWSATTLDEYTVPVRMGQRHSLVMFDGATEIRLVCGARFLISANHGSVRCMHHD